MKFEEKLMKLRKEKALSQEELGEKLNVTRQTVSKWELGQSKPEMDKLIEISKFFNVNLETLTNDEEGLENKKVSTNDTKGNRKYILIILVVVGILAFVTLIGKLVGGIFIFNKAKDSAEGAIDKILSFPTTYNQGEKEEMMNQVLSIPLDMYNQAVEEMDKEQEEREKEREEQEEKQKEEQYQQTVEQIEQMKKMQQMLEQMQ